MKKLSTLAAISAIALTGCNTPNHLEGRLALQSAISVNSTKVLGGTEVVAVPAGTYKTSFEMDQAGATMEIHSKNGTASFAVPSLKSDSLGAVNVSSATLGQEFSLSGNIFDTTYDIDRVVAQSCVHHLEARQVCNWETRCDNNQKNCHQEYDCEWQQVPVYGSENVHETGSQDTKNVSINMIKAAKTIGLFSGSYTYSENISGREIVSACAL